MLLSEQYKFIKIDIPKTGTGSFRENWKQFIDIMGYPSRSVNGFYQHDTASIVKKVLAKKNKNWDNYFSFTIIRNPWDRYVSFLYYHKLKVDEYSSALKLDVDITKTWKPLKIVQAKKWFYIFNFLEFDLQKILKYIILTTPAQPSFILENKEPIVNYIGKFENIESEYKYIINKLNINSPDFSHLNKIKYKKLSNSELYDQLLIDIVANRDDYIINKYGYQFK